VSVAGRGGRPRKWSSDVDRKRAFRARRRGVAEPPTLDAALERGDELARALERERQLKQELVDADRLIRELRRELTVVSRQLDRQRSQFGWIVAENRFLRSQLVIGERAAIQPADQQVRPLNRAARRRSARGR
jgi:hypothetical protein